MAIHFAFTLWLLICAHYVAEWTLQSDTMANAHNMDKRHPVHAFVPSTHWKLAHSMIHAASVSVATALACFLIHGTIILPLLFVAAVVGETCYFVSIGTDQKIHFFGKVILTVIILLW